MTDFYRGFDILEDTIKKYAEKADDGKILDILESGAEEFVTILLKLPRPRSDIKASGYTHLVDSFASRRNKNQVEVGWGKYYGPLVERGTTKMRATPHLKPAWEKNKEQIYNKMIERFKK